MKDRYVSYVGRRYSSKGFNSSMRRARKAGLNAKRAHPIVLSGPAISTKRFVVKPEPRMTVKRQKAKAKWMNRMLRKGLLTQKLAEQAIKILTR